MSIDTIEAKAAKIIKDSGTGGGVFTGGPGGRHRFSDDELVDPNDFTPSRPRILTAFLILVVVMTFGGLLAAYIVLATNRAIEWQPFSLPIPVFLSTAIILASSVTYHLAFARISGDNRRSAQTWFIATTILAGVFIASQLVAWFELNRMGLYVEGNPYAGFFYILTGVHAIHVVGGIIALGSLVNGLWKTDQSDLERLRGFTMAQVVGWYWHTMGALWIVIFVLLGFWK